MTITLAEAKAHLRVNDGGEDTLIFSLITAATRNAEAYTGINITQRQVVIKRNAFGSIWLRPPLISVDQITYVDSDGAAQTLYDTASSPVVSSSVFQVVGAWTSTDERIFVTPYITAAYDQTWPTTRVQPEAVSVTFTAGYSSTEIPDDIRAALLLMIGHLYENREATIPGVSLSVVPIGYYALLDRYVAHVV